jgi:hypothetical protein
MGTAVCFGPGCCVLVLVLVFVLSAAVLVLERSLAGTIIQVLRNVNLIPHSNYHHPITSTSTSTNSNSFSHGNS